MTHSGDIYFIENGTQRMMFSRNAIIAKSFLNHCLLTAHAMLSCCHVTLSSGVSQFSATSIFVLFTCFLPIPNSLQIKFISCLQLIFFVFSFYFKRGGDNNFRMENGLWHYLSLNITAFNQNRRHSKDIIILFWII